VETNFFNVSLDLGNLFSGVNDAVTGKWRSFGWPEAERNYRQRLIHLYGTLRILGNPKSIPLEGIFTDVYVLDKRSADRRFQIEDLECDPDEARERGMVRQNGLEVVKSEITNNRLFILGKPGAGKTTFLKYITLQAARGQLFAIPIFVSLKEWADSKLELFDFMVKQFEICQFPNARPFIQLILQQGKAIVLFDGLDEVQQENRQRAQLIDVLRDFSRQYLTSQCLITCRIAATDYSFEQFTYMEVADFTNEQINEYAKKWFSGEKLAKQALFFQEFNRPEHQGLRDLARTPLLLSLLCLGFEDSLRFPHRRVDIYEDALEVLLKKWDSNRAIQRDEIYRGLSLTRKRQLFARVAAETFQQGKYFIKQDFLVKHIETFLHKLPARDQTGDIDGEAVLKAIEMQHGIFVERAQKIYSFSHLTFQEYFTARYIADNPKAINELMQHCTDKRWREVFLLTASLLDENNADEFFAEFQRAVIALISQDETSVKLLNWANEKAIESQSPYKPAAVRSVYMFFSRSRRFNPVDILNLNIPLVFTFETVLFIVRILEPNLKHSLEFDCIHTISTKIRNDYILTIALYMVNSLTNLDSGGFQKQCNEIPKFFPFFANALEMCQEFPELQAELRHLTLPNENDRQSVWQEFEKRLRDIMQRHRNIGYEWNLTGRKLESYLEANILLVECLELAMVSDRQAIEDRVLLLTD